MGMIASGMVRWPSFSLGRKDSHGLYESVAVEKATEEAYQEYDVGSGPGQAWLGSCNFGGSDKAGARSDGSESTAIPPSFRCALRSEYANFGSEFHMSAVGGASDRVDCALDGLVYQLLPFAVEPSAFEKRFVYSWSRAVTTARLIVGCGGGYGASIESVGIRIATSG